MVRMKDEEQIELGMKIPAKIIFEMEYEEQIELGMKIPAKILFEALKDSEYMKSKRYEVLYSKVYSKKKKREEEQDGIKIIKKVESEKIEAYGVCFRHKKLFYIHLRILGDNPTSTFYILMTFGDKKQIEKDLLSLAKEIKEKFGKLEY